MDRFTRKLERVRTRGKPGNWILILPDQLNAQLGAVARATPDETGIVVLEDRHRAKSLPWHKQRLVLLWANQRQFALELAGRGFVVDYRILRDPLHVAVAAIAEEKGGLVLAEPAEWWVRQALSGVEAVEFVSHEGWLTTESEFADACLGKKSWRMDSFYRHVRRRSGILMEGGEPVGGKFSFDVENRKPWSGEPIAPDLPEFEADEVDREVVELVESEFADNPGQIDTGLLPTTAADAARLWRWALDRAMPFFGPFEDAMSVRSRTLFHTRISALLNLHRLMPHQVLDDVLGLDIPLASKEGFVRQVLGWREFVRHVHRETDGFRSLPDGSALDRGRGHLDADRDLPPAWWGARSGLNCLDRVVESVWEEGYSHHITRLMVLSNLATLLDVSPGQLSDWFHAAYTDSWDWVVEPNVLAMGTYATGPLMTTKPYVSGAAYINRMSDYCRDCAFDPKKNCPVTRLYWAFLDRNEPRLANNPRLAMPYRSLQRRSDAKREEDRRVFEDVSAALERGESLQP
jgi:deoxyribodipyrimidine photolyase-related protein